MRSVRLLVPATLILFVACTKTGNPSNSGSGSGNNGGTSGGNGNGLQVTSISPASPYPDDQITITGKGFSTDAGQDTVYFGDSLYAGVFRTYGLGTSDYKTTIVSASATQIVFASLDPLQLERQNQENFGFPFIRLKVGVSGKDVISSIIPFKHLPLLYALQDVEAGNNPNGRPGDSIWIMGSGFGQHTFGSLKVGNYVPVVTYDSNITSWLKFRLPPDVFGAENDEAKLDSMDVSLKLADGKTIHKNYSFFVSPIMKVTDMEPSQTTYSLATLGTTGGVVTIYIKGSNLKTDTEAWLSDGTTITKSLVTVGSDFPSQAQIQYSPTGLHAGNYKVSLRRSTASGDVVYSICGFTVQP